MLEVYVKPILTKNKEMGYGNCYRFGVHYSATYIRADPPMRKPLQNRSRSSHPASWAAHEIPSGNSIPAVLWKHLEVGGLQSHSTGITKNHDLISSSPINLLLLGGVCSV